MRILLNLSAHGGKAAGKWKRVSEDLERQGVPHESCMPATQHELERAVELALTNGERLIVAGGGDGTVNTVLNALMNPDSNRPRDDVMLGAIGLGSSNDYHKPFSPERVMGRIPVRIAHELPRRVDVGRADMRLLTGEEHVRYFLLNASVGIIAAGNAYAMSGARAFELLRRVNVEGAIIWAAVHAIATFRPMTVRLAIDEQPDSDLEVVNVSILKSVHFAGGMRYDTPVAPDDGEFAVNVWTQMSRPRIAAMVPRLYAGRFADHPAADCRRARTVTLRPHGPHPATALELDGEIFEITEARLSVIPRALRVCG